MRDSHLTRLLKPSLGGGSKTTKRIVSEFAEQTGMVYFGYVSQRDDDHHIVRGMTVSTKHHDDHYCIGTYDGYDAVFVERSDTLRTGKKHIWHIVELDLKTQADLPHVFIGSGRKGHGFHELLELKYPNLKPHHLESYPADFTSKFSAYVAPAHGIDFEQLVTPDVASALGVHFDGLVIEITEHALYVYSESGTASAGLLETMLKNGAWLAKRIDENSR